MKTLADKIFQFLFGEKEQKLCPVRVRVKNRY